MMKSFTISLYALLLSISFNILSGQEVWPGDVDNNGQVGAADLLYMGHAFGAQGYDRGNVSSPNNWAPIPLSTLWEQSFPDSVNFAYADASGNGFVDGKDFQLAQHFAGRRHGSLQDDLLLPIDSIDTLPHLSIIPRDFVARIQGNYLVLEIHLNAPEQDTLVRDVYGLGVRLQFPEGILANHRSTFDADDHSWIIDSEGSAYTIGFVDSTNHVAEFAITRFNQQSVSGEGYLMTAYVAVSADLEIEDLATTQIVIESAIIVNEHFERQALSTGSTSVANNNSCPLTINPVCGIDGVTYLNSCFAEAAGITFYTEGACFSPSIDVAQMDSTIDCGMVYAPVCGFNQITYTNACSADAHGVQLYNEGNCQSNNNDCYDPNLIVISSATTVSTFNGVITVNCPDDGQQVIGCDGNIYANACIAEASGIRSYTISGSNTNECIDPSAIDPNAACGNEQDFVCGCNGYTFVNACYAEAAGVTTYTQGPCGGSSQICAEATPISCGDYLPNETTIGAGNQISTYPGSSGSEMIGPDRVYVLQKTTAGDLQIGLEIMTAGLDMDIFLMQGECNNLVCIASSTSSNTITNNEGIILEDAPTGTYYIIVDQRTAGTGGNYRLEVSCGYLDCSNSVPLNCGVPYNGNNINGNDDISLYTCGQVQNVENNGPEVVHTFSISEAGEVAINLTGLSDNLELFLLSECDRGACIQYSQNGGNSNEQIVRQLPAGTYYVVVDGYNGAISPYTLTVDCSQNCGLSITPTGTTDAGCGQSNGVYNFSVYGGSPYYIATYSGPISGNQVSNTGHFCFAHLPSGNYNYTVRDQSGCLVNSSFSIQDLGGLQLAITPQAAACGSEGSFRVNVSGSQPPYNVILNGPEQTTEVSNSSYFALGNLRPGVYSVTVIDRNGCAATSSVTIEQGDGNLDFAATPYAAGCGALGRIRISVQNGQPVYQIRLAGPVGGIANVNSSNFTISDLPGGLYDVTLTDASGCSAQRQIVIPNGNLGAQVNVTAASCGNTGSATVNINNGVPPFTIEYFGPSSGTVTTSSSSVLIDNLQTGAYTFSIWDNAGCDISENAYLPSIGSNLVLNVSQADGNCGESAQAVVFNVSGGTPSYSIAYSGPETGTLVINGSGLGSTSLAPGNYTFIVNDFNGCSDVATFTVAPPRTGLTISSSMINNSCGQLQDIRYNIASGNPPYQVSVANNCGLPALDFTTYTTQITVSDVEDCIYTINITDASGCTGSNQITANTNSNLDLITLTPGDGGCGQNGFIDILVTGGDDPYYIDWTGPVSGSVALVTPTYRIVDAPSGTYTVNITTNDGCTDQEVIELNNSGGSITLNSTLVYTDCGQYDQIWNDIIGGTPPYTIETTRLCDDVTTTMTTTSGGFELTDLIPCDYKIKVTDANGCMIMNTTTVYPYQLFDAIPTAGLCGQAGQIEVRIMNNASTPPYQVSYTGPQSGSFSTSNTNFNLDNLEAGIYVISITDNGGCGETETVTVQPSVNDLDLQTALIINDCGQYNQLWNDINGGTAPYTVEVIRLCTNSLDTSFVTSDNGFDLAELDACDYKIKVTDANGCMDMETRTVNPSTPSFFTAVPVSGPCGQAGRIDISINGGTPPLDLYFSGPQSGSLVISTNSLSLSDLPSGDYTLTMSDANGCQQTITTTLEVTNSDLSINSALILNDCGQYNQIWNDVIGGLAPYNISVLRLCDNTQYTTFTDEDGAFELPDLPPCDYKIIVVDAAGCMQMDTVTVYPSAVDIFELETFNGACNELGGFTVNITNDMAPFTINYTGPISNMLVLNQAGEYNMNDLPSGSYSLEITNNAGCTQTEQFTIDNETSDLDLATAVIINDCGQYNQLWNDINGGIPPYNVEVRRLCDNVLDTAFTITNLGFDIPNLAPCEYLVKVTDANGCMASTTSDISSTNADLTDITVGSSCSTPSLTFAFNSSGNGPYRITLTGASQRNISNASGPIYTVDNITPGDYMVTVESSEGCREVAFIRVQSNGSQRPPTPGFSIELGGQEASFSNSSTAADSYLWDFGDGNNSTDENPTHRFDAQGTYNVCLTAVNECGANTICQEVEVVVGSINLSLGQVSGSVNQIVDVPVTINGLSNLVSLAGSFSLGDPNFGSIIGIQPALIQPNFNADNNSFSFFSGSSNGTPLVNGINNLLFYVQVRINARSGQSSIVFTDAPVDMEVSTMGDNGFSELIQPSRNSGMISVSTLDIASFDLMAETYNGVSINHVTFELSPADGNFVTTVESDNNGFAHMGMQQTDQMYYINAHKPSGRDNSLSTFSLMMGQRYIIGLPSPLITSPYQVVAGDVNCSGSFTTLDLHILQNMILGRIDEMPNCPNWLFIHESTEMPEDWNIRNVFNYIEEGQVQLMSDTMSYFVGVRKGDILGRVDPSNLTTAAEERSSGSFEIQAAHPNVKAGETFTLSLSADNLNDLLSLQFALKFDEEQANFIDAKKASNFEAMAIGDQLASRGQLGFSWFPLSGEAIQTNNHEIVELQLVALEDIAANSLTIEVANNVIKGMVHKVDLSLYQPTIAFAAPASNDYSESNRFEVAQNQPNPFNDITKINVQLPVEGDLFFRLTDVQGKQLMTRQQRYEAGQHQLTFNLGHLPAGLYHYQIRFGDKMVAKSMLIQR